MFKETALIARAILCRFPVISTARMYLAQECNTTSVASGGFESNIHVCTSNQIVSVKMNLLRKSKINGILKVNFHSVVSRDLHVAHTQLREKMNGCAYRRLCYHCEYGRVSLYQDGQERAVLINIKLL